MATRQARVLRGLVAALIAAFVAMLAHAAGGGAVPNLAGAAVAFALSAPASILLAGRSLSTFRLAIAVALSQCAFHILFWFTGSSSAAIVPRASASMLGTMHYGSLPYGSVPGATGMPGMSGMATSSSVPFGPGAFDGGMWAAHLGAAIVTVMALRYGEAAFWGVISTARVTLIRLVRTLITAPTSIRRIPAVVVVTTDDRKIRFLSPGLRHRGPPAFAPASAPASASA